MVNSGVFYNLTITNFSLNFNFYQISRRIQSHFFTSIIRGRIGLCQRGVQFLP